jgi:hypothetical protein
LERDAYKCTITGSLGADSGPPAQGALLDVTLVIPPSVDIRTLSRYAGLSNDDPLCAPTPRFYRLENMLTLDDDVSDAFRSLNVWLEEEKVSPLHPSISPQSISTRLFCFPLPSSCSEARIAYHKMRFLLD